MMQQLVRKVFVPAIPQKACDLLSLFFGDRVLKAYRCKSINQLENQLGNPIAIRDMLQRG
jgi:hypothetical protein